MKNLCLFDLDDTLLPIDSDHAWGEFVTRIGWVDPAEFGRRNDAFYAQYKAGVLDIHAYIRFATEPLRVTQTADVYDVDATLDGGGVSGQAGAIRLGIARALIALDPDTRPVLKKAGLLARDAREKERRKYGLKKARKAPQYSKR